MVCAVDSKSSDAAVWRTSIFQLAAAPFNKEINVRKMVKDLCVEHLLPEMAAAALR